MTTVLSSRDVAVDHEVKCYYSRDEATQEFTPVIILSRGYDNLVGVTEYDVGCKVQPNSNHHQGEVFSKESFCVDVGVDVVGLRPRAEATCSVSVGESKRRVVRNDDPTPDTPQLHEKQDLRRQRR